MQRLRAVVLSGASPSGLTARAGASEPGPQPLSVGRPAPSAAAFCGLQCLCPRAPPRSGLVGRAVTAAVLAAWDSVGPARAVAAVGPARLPGGASTGASSTGSLVGRVCLLVATRSLPDPLLSLASTPHAAEAVFPELSTAASSHLLPGLPHRLSRGPRAARSRPSVLWHRHSGFGGRIPVTDLCDHRERPSHAPRPHVRP